MDCIIALKIKRIKQTINQRRYNLYFSDEYFFDVNKIALDHQIENIS